ncbi:MAG TPA: TIGR04283 family arsenosugar biosynthesis glycosyltransferase [Blastocatellia bacterium]|nr:TIGR04283 family arsenosugar biosynthesis glycosyltransferase [Blastocatellia bacterium]
MMISIIIPTLDEATTIRETVEALRHPGREVEIIVADGGSADATIEIARACGLRVISASRGRGSQMNAGARLAGGEVFLFLHADTRLPEGALGLIRAALEDHDVCGGHFSLLFEGSHWGARVLTRIYPLLRLGGMCYGDSGFFVRRNVFEALGGFREIPLFEDCDFYRRLRRVGRFVRLAEKAMTSSRRFEHRFLRTFALWSALQILYWLGVDPHRLDRLYRPAR